MSTRIDFQRDLINTEDKLEKIWAGEKCSVDELVKKLDENVDVIVGNYDPQELKEASKKGFSLRSLYDNYAPFVYFYMGSLATAWFSLLEPEIKLHEVGYIISRYEAELKLKDVVVAFLVANVLTLPLLFIHKVPKEDRMMMLITWRRVYNFDMNWLLMGPYVATVLLCCTRNAITLIKVCADPVYHEDDIGYEFLGKVSLMIVIHFVALMRLIFYIITSAFRFFKPEQFDI